MSKIAQDAFKIQLWQVIEYFTLEYDLTFAEAVGILDLVTFDLKMEAREAGSDDEDEEFPESSLDDNN